MGIQHKLDMPIIKEPDDIKQADDKEKCKDVSRDVRVEDEIDEDDPRYNLTEEQTVSLNIGDDTVQAIIDVFRTLDCDGSGTLEASELETAMQQMGVECSSAEVEELLTQIDQDGNGSVDLYEFSRMVSSKMQDYDPERELREAFAVFDKNGDGKVTSDEIREVVESLGGKMTNDELESMLLEVDENNDGYLDYEEFVRVWVGDSTPESERIPSKTEDSTPGSVADVDTDGTSTADSSKTSSSNLLTVPKEKR